MTHHISFELPEKVISDIVFNWSKLWRHSYLGLLQGWFFLPQFSIPSGKELKSSEPGYSLHGLGVEDWNTPAYTISYLVMLAQQSAYWRSSRFKGFKPQPDTHHVPKKQRINWPSVSRMRHSSMVGKALRSLKASEAPFAFLLGNG